MPANPTATATLELNAIDNVTATVKKVTGTVDDLRGAYDKLGNVLKTLSFGLAGGLGVGWFAGMIKGAIESENALYELSLKTGATVETLSALRGVAKASGTDMEQVGTMIQRLTKQMYEFADTGKGKAAQAFGELGYSQEQVKKSLGDMNAFLPEFARRLLTTGSASEQVAMAQQLMSRSGANSLAFLHQLVETGTLVPNVFYEQARAAHEFEVNLARIEGSSKAAWRALANDLLPGLNKISEAFADAYKQGGLLAGVIAGIQTTITGDDLDKATAELEGLAKRRGALLNKIDELGRDGDFATPGAKGDKGPGTLGYWREQLEAVDKQITAIRHYREELVATEEAKRKSAELALTAHEGAGGTGNSPRGLSAYDQEWNQLIGKLRQVQSEGSEAAKVLHAVRAGDYGEISDKQGRELVELAAEVEYRKQANALQAEYEKVAERIAEEAAKHELARANQLQAEAEHYRDLLDPARQYVKEQEKLRELVDAGKLSEDEAVRVQRKLLEARTKVEDLGKSADLAAQSAHSIGLSFTSAMDKLVFDSGRGVHAIDFLRAAAMDVVKILYGESVSRPTANAISGGLAGLFNGSWFGAGASEFGTGMTADFAIPFARGGVMTPHGPLPLKRYDMGGVADSPQLAMFGEGSMSEAYVPLPDGRSIPVNMRGGGGDTHNFYIDARGADRSGMAQLNATVQALGGSIRLQAVDAVRKHLERRGSRLT